MVLLVLIEEPSYLIFVIKLWQKQLNSFLRTSPMTWTFKNKCQRKPLKNYSNKCKKSNKNINLRLTTLKISLGMLKLRKLKFQQKNKVLKKVWVKFRRRKITLKMKWMTRLPNYRRSIQGNRKSSKIKSINLMSNLKKFIDSN